MAKRFFCAEAARVRHSPQRRAGGFQRIFCARSEEHTSELQSQSNLVCRLLLEKKKPVNSFGWIFAATRLPFTATTLSVLNPSRFYHVFTLHVWRSCDAFSPSAYIYASCLWNFD